jgi:hypothetical protein
MSPAILQKSLIEQRITEAGGPSPINVLVVCGDALRRASFPESARPEDTERALEALSIEDASAAVLAIDFVGVKRDLTRAGQDAFDAAFTDDPEERTLFASAAMAGLAGRDRAASALAAAQMLLSMSTSETESLSTAIASAKQSLGDCDQGAASLARSLTGINRERRAELAKLDAGATKDAWWYSARSSEADDALLLALGALSSEAERALSPEGQRDLAATDRAIAHAADRSST